MATYHVTQSGAGSHNGTSLANAWSVSEHNAASLSPGDVVVLNGTLTSTVVVPSSGSSGNRITYQFATGAKFSAGTFAVSGTSGGAINAQAKGHITIDGNPSGLIGGKGGNSALANGIIECTANGTELANQAACIGVLLTACSNVTVKGLLIRNMYVRTSDTDQTANGDECTGIAISQSASPFTSSNILVENCIIHDAGIGVYSDCGVGSSNYEFSHLTIYNINWGANCSDRNNASTTMDSVWVHDCWIYNWANWNDTVANAFHHNGVFVVADAGVIENITVERNWFGPGYGNSYQTSGIYINTGIGATAIRNNIFEAGVGESCGNGFITFQTARTTTAHIENNTLIGGGSGGNMIQMSGPSATSGSGTPTYVVKNNLGIGNGDGTFISMGYNAGVTLDADYNLGYDFGASIAYSYSATGSSSFQTFAQWRALGFDANGLTSDPNLDAEFAPQAGSAAIDAGTDLSAYFTTDYNGDSRNDPWDIGAIRFVNSMADSLTLTQTANTDPVTELWKRATIGGGAPSEVLIEHSGDYPSQPINDYVYALHGTDQKLVFVFDASTINGVTEEERLASAIASRP